MKHFSSNPNNFYIWLHCICQYNNPNDLCIFPQAVHTHSAIDEAAQGMNEAVDDLSTTLEEAASEFGIVSGMVDSITKAIGNVSARDKGGGANMFSLAVYSHSTGQLKTAYWQM